ncbi:MAG: M48 family metallopeptidase [Bryobacteraceae bacterium]
MFPALLLAAKTYTLPPDKLAKAIAYAAARNRLHFIAVAYGILVLIALLAWHVAPRLRNLAESVTRRRIVQGYIFVPLLLLVIDIIELPIGLYAHRLAMEFEQSIQSWASWFWDWTKGELLLFALAGIAAWVLYGAMRRSPRRWWFYFWLISVPMVVFLMFIEPVAIEPLFFEFEPLAANHPALVTAIERVVARGGLEIPPDRMFEMKASEKLTSLNAYVTGIGASKRVVVWDNTIQKMNTGEILFVFGHEMGHYVLHHVWIGVGAAVVGILVFLFLAYHAMRWALARYGGRWEIRDMRDWASLPVLLLALAIFGFLSEPLASSFSRMLEHNADIYGLEVIHGIVPNSSEEAAQAFQILGEVSLDDPNPTPFIEFWLYDHPSISERVRFASEYDPWDTGQQPKYVH